MAFYVTVPSWEPWRARLFTSPFALRSLGVRGGYVTVRFGGPWLSGMFTLRLALGGLVLKSLLCHRSLLVALLEWALGYGQKVEEDKYLDDWIHHAQGMKHFMQRHHLLALWIWVALEEPPVRHCHE